VRIIAGRHRGRRIAVPDAPGLRPTPDRVRETLFNWLGQWLEGLSCLDLFAGSGALGFEAASRGAKRVVMVERSPSVMKALEKSAELLRMPEVELVRADALDYLSESRDKSDLVFLDPPFGQNALPAVLERLPRVLAAGARVYVESARRLEAIAGFTILRQDRAGQVSYQLLRWGSNDQGGVPGNV
jgi:16S rRNA (guanine966-N2)-methyltransferase